MKSWMQTKSNDGPLCRDLKENTCPFTIFNV
jgi:hypothetical protein